MKNKNKFLPGIVLVQPPGFNLHELGWQQELSSSHNFSEPQSHSSSFST